MKLRKHRADSHQLSNIRLEIETLEDRLNLAAPTAVDDMTSTNEDTAITIDVLDNDTDPENDPLTIVTGDITVADYQDEFQSPNYPAGWQYLWNETGAFGDAASYSDLTWLSWRYFSGDVTNFPQPYLGSTYAHAGPGLDDGQADERFAIAAFTVTQAGEYSIANSSITRVGPFGDGVGIAAHVGNGAVIQLGQTDPVASLESFDGSLGYVAAGETIYIGLGPDGTGAGSGQGNDGVEDFDFSIVRSAVAANSAKGAAISTDGSTIDYDPAGMFESLQVGESDTDTFQYEITDGNGGMDSATVTVTIDGVNDAPVAVDDTVDAFQDSDAVVAVLNNDTDVDDATLSIASFTQPANGTVTDNGDGTLSYTPNPGYTGPDSFNYTTSDSQNAQDTAAVAVTVLQVDQATVALDAGVHRFVDGTREFDRARYITTHGDLWTWPSERSDLWDPNEIHAVKSRYDTTLDGIAFGDQLGGIYPNGLPEDPANPGFIDPVILQQSIDAYINWVNTGDRHQPIREYAQLGTENKNVFVVSGRNIANKWPDYLLTDQTTGQFKDNIPLNYPGYADLVNRFLASNPWPVNSDRLYFEIINEPNFHFNDGYTIQNLIDLHTIVPDLIRAQHPEILVGGPSYGGTGFRDQEGWDLFRQLMAGAGSELDFWSFHPYDRYDIGFNNVVSRKIITSAGRLTANLDLIENYSHEQFGTPKLTAITEYGDWILENGDYSQYSRQQRMWDQVHAIMEKMLVFMDRPDAILAATPFINTYEGGGGGASQGDAWSTRLWVDDDNGNRIETTVAKMYRLFTGVKGNYVSIGSTDANLQTQAYRDGNKVYLILNNLQDAPIGVNLNALAGSFGTITNATLRSLEYVNGVAQFDPGSSLPNWQQYVLGGQGKAVMVFDVAGPETYDLALNERTFYGDSTNVTVNGAGVAAINVTTDLDEAVSAKIRFSYMRPDDTSIPAISVNVNGTVFNLAAGLEGYDDTDPDVTAREIDVPVSLLNDGSNTVTVTFPTGGGNLLSVVAVVTQTMGDFNGSGAFDHEDRFMLFNEFGSAVTGFTDMYDRTGDGTISQADLDIWNELRGEAAAGVDSPSVAYANETAADYTDQTLHLAKKPLLPGETATSENFTNYSRGLNRVVLAIDGLVATSLTASDFEFRVGNTDDPANWLVLGGASSIPLPAINVIPEVGRVELTWPDNQIENAWLQVTVKSNANTGIPTDSVFYFGNQVGDVNGDVNIDNKIRVNSFDTGLTRLNQSPVTAVSMDNVYDVDRNGLVNSFDTGRIRLNQSLGGLLMFTAPLDSPPSAPSAPLVPAPEVQPSAVIAPTTIRTSQRDYLDRLITRWNNNFREDLSAERRRVLILRRLKGVAARFIASGESFASVGELAKAKRRTELALIVNSVAQQIESDPLASPDAVFNTWTNMN